MRYRMSEGMANIGEVLKEAMERTPRPKELEQEPVAKVINGRAHFFDEDVLLDETLLYTTPPQRTWVGLTLDRRIELAQDVDWAAGAYCEYAEKIEAELKDNNA